MKNQVTIDEADESKNPILMELINRKTKIKREAQRKIDALQNQIEMIRATDAEGVLRRAQEVLESV